MENNFLPLAPLANNNGIGIQISQIKIIDKTSYLGSFIGSPCNGQYMQPTLKLSGNV